MRRTPGGVAKPVTVGVFAISLMGCASEGDLLSADPPSSTTVAPPSEGTTTVAPLSEDKTLATSALLDVSDLPDGWRLDPDSALVDDPAAIDQGAIDFNRERYSCLDGDASMMYAPPGANGALRFFLGPFEAGLSTKVMLATPEEVETLLNSLASEEGQACWTQAAMGELTAAHATGKPIVTRRNLSSRSDQMVAYRIETPITFGNQEVTSYQDYLFARKGRAYVSVAGVDSEEPLPDELTVSVLNKILDRLP